MPLDPSIYGLLDTKGLQSGLQNIANQYVAGQERKDRLSQLARQNELTDMQIRAGQRAESLIPEQQRQKDMQELSAALAFGIKQKNGISNQYLMERTYEEAMRRGLKDEDVAQLFQPWASAKDETDGQSVSNIYAQKANPAEAIKQQLEAIYRPEKQATSTALGNIYAEREKIASQNPNDPRLAMYDQLIEKTVTTPPAMQVVTSEGGGMQAVTLPKAPGQRATVQPLGIQAVPKATKESQLSPTAQKELFEADENIQTATGVNDTLNQALALNKKSYSGYGALLRAKAESNLPGKTDEKATNTILMDNLIREQALSSMKMIFGGNPTEGERAVLVELQASADKTPEQREAILKRAMTMANNKLKFNQKKAESLRGGTYFKESPSDKQIPVTGGAKFLGFE